MRNTPVTSDHPCGTEGCPSGTALRTKCDQAVRASAWSCRLLKWGSALGYVIAAALVLRSSYKLDTLGSVDTEYGLLMVSRMSIITVLFMIHMWAMNQVIRCAWYGGVPLGREKADV